MLVLNKRRNSFDVPFYTTLCLRVFLRLTRLYDRDIILNPTVRLEKCRTSDRKLRKQVAVFFRFIN